MPSFNFIDSNGNITETTMFDNRAFLRVKLKSLAAEAGIIRFEERRNKRLRVQLADHRRTSVRQAARNTALAYGFARGRSYDQIEKNATTQPNWAEVQRMIDRYTRPQSDPSFEIRRGAWIKGAIEQIEANKRRCATGI